MNTIWGMIVAVLALLAWGGQTVSLFAPEAAAKLGLFENEAEVEPAFWADARGEVLWDFFTLWTLLVAGVLLIVDAVAWPYFGIAGGAIYAYFGGRGVLTRRELQRRDLRIGSASNVKSAYLVLPVWGVAGLITLIAGVVAVAD